MAARRGLCKLWLVDTKAALAKLLTTPELPDLGPGPRPGVQPQAALEGELNKLFQGADLSETNRQLVRALILLWHDHLEPAHVLAQNIENADGAFVHGIMHRREPDYGNAKYWFRRVGKHPAFPEIARRVGGLLASTSAPELRDELLAKGEWDALAFIDACERAADRPATGHAQELLRQIQAIETETLLERFCR